MKATALVALLFATTASCIRLSEEDQALEDLGQQRQHEQNDDTQFPMEMPKICIPQMAGQSMVAGQAYVMLCLTESAMPLPPQAHTKGRCGCLQEGKDVSKDGMKAANCRQFWKLAKVPLKLQKMLLGCFGEPVECDDLKADKAYNKCLFDMKECMDKEGVNIDVTYIDTGQGSPPASSLLEGGDESVANGTRPFPRGGKKLWPLRRSALFQAGGDGDDDTDDPVCSCSEDAVSCVKLAALDNNCMEKAQDYTDIMEPQRDNICTKPGPNDQPVKDGDCSKDKTKGDSED
eukprot:TRINITY_DN90419_c0_g1_i1.p1 TRINITY_DN90419_c0_g1~~TRINITY_DN90419_c0_g1_i1.p1  ORF type:complete len:290 (+),score=73.48 TRINITY_DN90419_c0_g1_i1:179-1048(+)